ncbi:TonB-dependent siderophore receptor [Synechocystis sp. PCC 7338]|nr:TonB-dependent siderophore receptor [Synechocystis sp. PCC 7338]
MNTKISLGLTICCLCSGLVTPLPVLAQFNNYGAQTKIQAQVGSILVTGVNLKLTEKSLELELENNSSTPLQPLIYPQENLLIIELTDALLDIPGGEFSQENPSSQIAAIAITQGENNIVRITVTGVDNNLPEVTVSSVDQNLVLSLTSSSTAIAPENPESEIEVVATQEGQDESSYFVPSASTATGLDTPLLDIPQSIQVVPQQVLQDRNVNELGPALQTVPGVSPNGGRGTSVFGPGFLIRGFPVQGSIFRDGIPYQSLGPLNTTDIEQIEVLKGPSSIVFGAGEPGGSINLISKKPLDEPYYNAAVSLGNYNDYRLDVDLSGPLLPEAIDTVNYRLNVSYETSSSFRDFVYGDLWVVSPTLTWNIGPDTKLNIYGQYTTNRETLDEGIPATNIADLPSNRFLGERFSKFEQDQYLIGYTFNHDFNENLKLRHAMQYLAYAPVRYAPLFDFFDEDTGELNRFEYYAGGNYQRFFTNAELVGEFYTGPVKHRVLFGLEYRNDTETPEFQFSNSFAPINVFNPVYTNTPFPIAPEFFRDDQVNRFAVYLQDQMDLFDNLKLLVGLRYDSATQNRSTQSLTEPREEFNQTDDQLTPRVGIIYQPIPSVSLYGSYTTSFNPSFAASLNADGSTFDPQTGRQFEVGVKADITDKLSVTFSAFDIRKQNVPTIDPANPLFTIQTGEQTSRGVELYLGGEILPGWNIVTGYSYLDAFVSQDNTDIVDNTLANVPSNQFSLWTTYEIQSGDLQGLGFGLGLFYVDQRAGDLDNTFVLPSYFRTDAAVFYRRENWELQLNIENLFNSQYLSASNGFDLSTYPGAPFTVMGKIGVKF